MPYRPKPEHRRNIGVIMPLTAAIYQVFGSRAQNNGRSIGAFYPENVSAVTWQFLGGIWYRARDEQKVLDRNVNTSVVQAFSQSIHTGADVELPSGAIVSWEVIPPAEASRLPPPLIQ